MCVSVIIDTVVLLCVIMPLSSEVLTTLRNGAAPTLESDT